MNWSKEFLGRRDTDQVYPVSIIRDEQVAMGTLVADRVVEDENSKGGQPPKH